MYSKFCQPSDPSRCFMIAMAGAMSFQSITISFDHISDAILSSTRPYFTKIPISSAVAAMTRNVPTDAIVDQSSSDTIYPLAVPTSYALAPDKRS